MFDKIINRFNIQRVVVMIFSTTSLSVIYAQKNVQVIKKYSAYTQLVAKDSLKKMVELKIWDAYRPYRVTVKMWKRVKDDRYVADPRKGSGHNRGIAVDLTIINKTTGAELDMGTGFDNFSDTAHQDFKNLPPEILQNRSLLKAIMEKYDFRPLETEWWHFYWNNSDFELLDIDPEKFKKN